MTHHEILQLVAPFTRRGCHVDLKATDRLQRRVAFKSIEHREHPGAPSLLETLVLDDLGDGSYRLTRRLSPEAGPEASLEAQGTQTAELLACIDAVPPQRQFRAVEAVTIAMSFRLQPGLIFARGVARIAGLDFSLDASTVTRGPAKFTLTHQSGDALRLPQDTLAVLGAQWSRLQASGQGWAGELRLTGKEPRRSLLAEAAIEAAARHLARMLSEAPRRFHERYTAARWRVFSRRLLPLALCVGLILCAAAVPRLHLAERSGLRMLILNSPPILLILCLALREIPVVEIPPLPRRSDAPSWRAEATQAC